MAERDFENFKKRVNEIAAESLNRNGLSRKVVSSGYLRKTSEEIEEILTHGNEEELRNLSQSYWDLSGLYKRMLIYMANMLTYDLLVVPKIISDKKPDKNKVLNNLTGACNFLDSLHLEKELSRIMTIILQDGVYFGFFKDCGNDKYIFQDLNPAYCRTRYKSANDLPVLEFNLNYFITLKSNEVLTNVDELALYPPIVIKEFNKWINGVTTTSKGKRYIKPGNKLNSQWMIIPDGLGVAFYYKDTKPLFASVIKAIEDLNEYKGLEKSLDEQDLKKILLQRIPMNKDSGELLFTLDEALEIHRGAVNMLKNNPDIDVLTTFAETSMLNLQDSSKAKRDNLEKMERSVYNEAGMSKNLFASDGTTALEYSQNVDLALAFDIAKVFVPFLNYQINKKFVDKKFFLEVSILPITHYNREEMFDLYLKGAQYGYSKILAGVASGIKQSNLLNLITLENEFLDLSNIMIPLQSSHTTSQTGDNGAPKKGDKEKSDKTRQNEESL